MASGTFPGAGPAAFLPLDLPLRAIARCPPGEAPSRSRCARGVGSVQRFRAFFLVSAVSRGTCYFSHPRKSPYQNAFRVYV